MVRNDPFGAPVRPLVDDEQRPVDSGPGKVVGAVLAELLAQRVVELLEAGNVPRLDPAQILAAIVALLGAAGLVSVSHFPLGGRDRLALLVAEPLPRGQVSVGVELAGTDGLETLVPRLRRHAEHPAVDALVVVGTGPCLHDLPRQIGGVPVRSVVLDSWGGTTARSLPPVRPPAS